MARHEKVILLFYSGLEYSTLQVPFRKEEAVFFKQILAGIVSALAILLLLEELGMSPSWIIPEREQEPCDSVAALVPRWEMPE